jgi:DNA-binding CsgD family transcriptional regulator/GAF domain-containing protein
MFDVTDDVNGPQMLHELAVATAGVLDPQAVAHLAIGCARRLVGAGLVTLYLVDHTSDMLRPFAATDPRVVGQDVPVPAGVGALGRAFTSGEALVISDYARWEGAMPSANPGSGAATAVPLWASGKVFGVMGVTFEQAQKVPEEHVEILQLLTAQIAPVIQVARLHARTERVRRVTDAALAHLPDSSLEQMLVTRVAEVLGVDQVGLLVLDDSGEWFTLRSAVGLTTSVTGERAAGGGFVGRVTEDRRVVSAQVEQSADLGSPVLRDTGIRSVLGAPMFVAGRLTGVLLAGSADRHDFSPEDAEMLQMVTDRIASHVDRMRIFEAERRATTEVSAQRARLYAILEQIPSGVVVLDRTGKIVLRNAASRRIAGNHHDWSRPLADQVSDFMIRDMDGRLLQPEETPGARALRGERMVEFEGLMRPPGSNADITVRIAAVPLRATDGQIDGALIVYTDVTREKLALRDLQATALNHARLLGQLAEKERLLSVMINPAPTHAHRDSDADAERKRLERLTPREVEILQLLVSGLSPRQIPTRLNLSAGTVKNHIGHVVAKLEVEDRAQAVLLAVRLGVRPT